MVELSSTTKRLMRRAGPNIFYLLLIMAVIITFGMSMKWAIITIISGNLILWVKNAWKIRKAARLAPTIIKPTRLLTDSLYILVWLHILYWIFFLLGPWGIWGLIIGAVLIVLYKMFRRWDDFIAVKHEAERALMGGETIREHYENKRRKEQ